MSTTEVHKVTLLIVDHDRLGAEGVIEEIKATHFANYCISPNVTEVETREVEWDDKHPLNQPDTWRSAYKELFPNDADFQKIRADALEKSLTALIARVDERQEEIEKLRSSNEALCATVGRLVEWTGVDG